MVLCCCDGKFVSEFASWELRSQTIGRDMPIQECQTGAGRAGEGERIEYAATSIALSDRDEFSRAL